MMKRRSGAAALAVALLTASAPAVAQAGPEDFVQIEPGAGEWQLEYAGDYGGEDGHQVEALFGLSDRLAIGAEAEFEGRRLDGVAAIALVTLADPDEAPMGMALAFSAELDRDGGFAGGEARFIAERTGERWWLQGDLILRHAREEGERGTGVAYALSAQRNLGGDIWLGGELTGQLARLGGDPELAPAGAHYAGPSLTIERELGAGEIEIGAAWAQRLSGEGRRSGPRLFVQLTL